MLARAGNHPDRRSLFHLPDHAQLFLRQQIGIDLVQSCFVRDHLGDDIIVYKRRSTYVGRYTGPAEVWNFTQVDSDVGCVGQDAVCDTGKAHFFIGDDDIYAFDGVQVQPIGRGVLRDWGAVNAAVTAYPGERFGAWFPETFDRVLLDAPCSMDHLRPAPGRAPGAPGGGPPAVPARAAGALTFALAGKWMGHVLLAHHFVYLPLAWVPWQLGLVDRLWAALRAGDEQQITRMLARIDDNAARIRQKMCEIKRLNQAVGKTPVQT